MDTFTWYQSLVRPGWAPPAWLFGPAWTFLYAIIIITFGAVFYKTFKKTTALASGFAFFT